MIHVVSFSFCKGQRLFIFLKENSIKSKKTTCASFVVSFPAFFIMHVIEVLSFKVLVCLLCVFFLMPNHWLKFCSFFVFHPTVGRGVLSMANSGANTNKSQL